MRAKVKEGQRLESVRSAGIWFTVHDWTYVPEQAEAEISANPYLMVEPAVPDNTQPEPPIEPEPEPQTVQAKAVKVVMPRKAKGVKKL